MTDSSKILLDTGPSSRGWHRLEAMARCARFYGWRYANGRGVGDDRLADPTTDEKLVRGSIGHVGLAHVYARERARKLGENPDRYYFPEEAMELVARKFGSVGLEMLPTAQKAVAAYLQFYATDQFDILGVEKIYSTMVSDSRGRGPYPFTARIDLEYAESSGKIVLVDHKFISKIESKTLKRYTLSGQFLGHRWIGQAVYGDRFGGVVVNLVQVGDNPRFSRLALPPAPGLEKRFPTTLCDLEERISAAEAQATSPLDYTPSPTEMTCMIPYGACSYFERCQWE
jgi:hypothetical protein